MIAIVDGANVPQLSQAHGDNNNTERPPLGSASAAWKEVNRLINEHPIATRVLGATLLSASAPVLAPYVSLGALNLMGFGAAGPVGGTLAPVIQSDFYGDVVPSGSLFAGAQAAARGGIAVASTSAHAAAATLATAGGRSRWRGKQEGRQRTPAPANDDTTTTGSHSNTPKPHSLSTA